MKNEKPKIKNVEEFIARLKKRETVDRFENEYGFVWTAEASAKLVAVLKTLHSADLRYADLRFANLHSANLGYANLGYAKGEFSFNFGVKLKVI